MDAAFLPITSGDLDCAIAMMAQLYAHDGVAFDSGRARRATEGLMAEPASGGVWMIHAEGKPVGYLALVLGYSLEFGGGYGLLDEVFVEELWRGRGIGTQALAFACRECQQRGWRALRLEVGQRNHYAMALYRKAGFEMHDRYLMTKWM